MEPAALGSLQFMKMQSGFASFISSAVTYEYKDITRRSQEDAVAKQRCMAVKMASLT